ncbi:non-ribosomal peptide synthetase [Streptomyces chattanoogensis]|uniref:non-ribosomal peptide synthetase n=1 Tax=Streptomyces chattanoogensis TaxID=66876 RepID=UPI0006B6129A|nr:non-ribosomal peptide synthetase [Streptomyces chattanoogensis]
MSKSPIESSTPAVPVLMPADRPRGRTAPRCDAVEAVTFSALVSEALEGLAKAAESDPATVLHAGLVALLHRYTGRELLPVAHLADAAPKGAAVEAAVPDGATLRDLLRYGAPAPGLAGHDVPAVAFAVGPGGAGENAPYELLLRVRNWDGPMSVELHYDSGLFDPETARRFLSHYRTLLEAGLERSDAPVASLRLLPPEEETRLLVEWNDTAAGLPYEVCLHRAFEDRAAETPDTPAVIHSTGSLSFHETNSAANRLAHHLRALGVGPESRVGLCMERSPELLVAVLAVLKAGGAYVPLDPEYPAQRLATMVQSARCSVMISRSGLSGALPASGIETVLVDRDAELIADRPEGNPEGGAQPDDLCYVIFTSGSTGTPKPIALRHRGVANNLADLNSRYGIGAGDRVLGLSSPSFDMSVYEMLGMTTAGGTLVLPHGDRAKDPAHWAELVAAHHITVWNSAPALLELLVSRLEEGGAQPVGSLRLAMLGGDWIPVPLPDRIRRLAPRLRFIALGGATEASIHSTLFEVTETQPDWTSIPYGVPMANQRTYILDEERRPVPIGVPGELYLAGIGLAREYLGEPERTSERFTEWSHGPVTGERVYRTGDLARYRPDGVIELLGRLDFQVKIRGLRVELGEIEAVLRTHPAVRQSVVTARTDATTGDRHLAGYVTLKDGVVLADGELRSYAGEFLASYMLPSTIVVLEELPLSANGKLDRRALPDPAPTADATDDDAPRDVWEEHVARVWQEVLGLDSVGRDADFFALGGDSMKAIRSMPKISPALKWAELYRNPTVKALAAHLRVITKDTPPTSAPSDEATARTT